MIDIPSEPDEKNHHAQLHVDRAAGPVGGGEGAVGGEVAADCGGVDELEEEGREPDGEVDGRHGGIEEEGGEEGAVEIVEGLVVGGLAGCAMWKFNGRMEQGRRGHTKRPAMSQLARGRLSMPFWAGRVNIMYKSVMKPGASIVAQPILPGMLKRDSVEVLPMG